MGKFTQFAQQVTNARAFEIGIIAVIIFNALLLGIGTSPTLDQQYGTLTGIAYEVILGIFVVEALLKMVAATPRFGGYFRDGWNVFDFLVIVLALIPFTGQFTTIVRLARLLRVMRLVTTIKDLRVIVTALVNSIPSVGHVIMLMSIIVYIYAVIGYHLFSEHDPDRWQNIGFSVLTLFNIITFDGWTDAMFTAMELNPWAWVYFVSFVVIGTFVVINLFIAILIDKMGEAKLERHSESQTPVTREEVLQELKATQEKLQSLEERLRQS
jgi:voltage-gated sodium channel